MTHISKVNGQNIIHGFLEKMCMSPQKFASESKVGVAKNIHFWPGILFFFGLEAHYYSLLIIQ